MQGSVAVSNRLRFKVDVSNMRKDLVFVGPKFWVDNLLGGDHLLYRQMGKNWRLSNPKSNNIVELFLLGGYPVDPDSYESDRSPVRKESGHCSLIRMSTRDPAYGPSIRLQSQDTPKLVTAVVTIMIPRVLKQWATVSQRCHPAANFHLT